MKYELLKKALCIKINTKYLDKINLFAVSETARKRVNFMYELNHQINKSLRNNTIIEMRSLIDAYSMGKLEKNSDKTIRRLLNELLNENITYSDFIFTKKIGNNNRELKNVNKEELLIQAVEIFNKIKTSNIPEDLSKEEKKLIYKDRKVTFEFIWKKLTVDGISPSCLLKYLRENGFESDYTRKRKKERIHKKKKEDFYKLYEKLNVTIKHNIAISSIMTSKKEVDLNLKNAIKKLNKVFVIKDLIRKYKKESNKCCWGEIVEIDACQHRWYGYKQMHLYLAVDKSTGVILAYHIEEQETTAGYVILLTKLFTTWGIPKEIHTDKRTTFWKCRNDGTSNTPLANVLKNSGCILLSDSNPNFKPIVEGTFEILQKYLPAEASFKEILSLEEYLPFFEDEIQKYNDIKLSKKSKRNNFFERISDFELKAKFINSFRKTVTDAATVQIGNKHYKLEKNEFGCGFSPKYVVSIKESFFEQGIFWYSHGTSKIKLIETDFEEADNNRIEQINKTRQKNNKEKVNY